MAEVTVDIELDDFSDADLLEEVKLRGLMKDDSVGIVELAESLDNATILRTGIADTLAIEIGKCCKYSSKGKVTIIVIDGE